MTIITTSMQLLRPRYFQFHIYAILNSILKFHSFIFNFNFNSNSMEKIIINK